MPVPQDFHFVICWTLRHAAEIKQAKEVPIQEVFNAHMDDQPSDWQGVLLVAEVR